MIFPEFQSFSADYEAGKNQVVYTWLAADLETPVSLYMKLAKGSKKSFLLQSVTGGEVRGRYSAVGLNPDLIWKCHGKKSCLNRKALSKPDEFVEIPGDDPLGALRGLLGESQIEIPDALPSVAAGFFGYLGYDMVRLVENLPAINPDPIGAPDAILMRPSIVAVLDGIKNEVAIVSPIWANSGLSADQAYEQACARLWETVAALEEPLPKRESTVFSRGQSKNGVENLAPPVSNFTKEDYMSAVKKAKEYIAAGDIFQVVPSQRWTQEFDFPPFELYRALQRLNPSPFLFFQDFSDFQIIGSSPEILVRLRGREVTIRPIAGTRPRGQKVEEDRALEVELLADEKELAEHLMLLDLGRNDVSRTSKVGTVHPTEEFIIERYSHVMHIVSTVVGELVEDGDALSALLAGLPAGTVSGAPKIRAMEIIDELEPEKRGIYGGGSGYFSANGDMDMCIALRTGVLKDKNLYIQAGGGVVYDSDPEAEFQETVNKSKALFTAAGEVAQNMAGKNAK